MADREFARRDVEIRRGIQYTETLVLEESDGAPVDLTGHTVTSVIKTTEAVDGSTLVAFTVTVTDATAGEFTMTLTEAQTTALTASSLVGYWFLYYSGPSTDDKKMPVYSGRVKVV